MKNNQNRRFPGGGLSRDLSSHHFFGAICLTASGHASDWSDSNFTPTAGVDLCFSNRVVRFEGLEEGRRGEKCGWCGPG